MPMREGQSPSRSATDRFLDLVDQRVSPVLAQHGFVRRRNVLERDAGDVRWLVEVELAPWTSPEKICFTLAWGVAVPGLEDALGDDLPPPSRVDECLVTGRLGEGAQHIEATWFTIGPTRAVPGLDRVADGRTALAVVRLVQHDLLPALQRLDSVPAVQEHLVEHLVRGRGAAAESELQGVRWIAGLSLLLGERENASRWLDYLEARSSSRIAPDVVAQRLASLRQRCAS
jgi:hypothetical protein